MGYGPSGGETIMEGFRVLSINENRCTPMFCHRKYMNIVVLLFKIMSNHWKVLHTCALSSRIVTNRFTFVQNRWQSMRTVVLSYVFITNPWKGLSCHSTPLKIYPVWKSLFYRTCWVKTYEQHCTLTENCLTSTKIVVLSCISIKRQWKVLYYRRFVLFVQNPLSEASI